MRLRVQLLCSLGCILLLAIVACARGGDVSIDALRCEYLTNPLGIDAVAPRLSWELDSSQRGQKQTAYRILVADDKGTLAQNCGNLWDSGKVDSDRSVQAPYGGSPLTSRMRCWWKVRVWDKDGHPSAWSAPATWTMGLLNPDDWSAQWIGITKPDGLGEYPRLRKVFVLDDTPTKAWAYVNSLGHHKLYINGRKVGDDVLSPAVSQLSQRSFYLTHDVSAYLHKGTNCIALSLGRGWYYSSYLHLDHPVGPVAQVQLELSLADGADRRIVTDGTWKAHPSPFRRTGASAWAVCYDARQEQPGWNTADFDDHGWQPASVCNIAPHQVRAQMVEPNRIVRVIKPVRIERHGDDSWLVDMGTNLTGWLRLRMRGPLPAGRKISVHYSDHLEPDGQPTGDGDCDEYIASGKGNELLENRVSYQAYRYATITGLTDAPTKEDVAGCLIRTGYASAGDFTCSNPRLTAIHDMIAYTLQCLTLGGDMVDCPHYERLGYGGDGHASIESALMLYGLGPLYRSWMAAWRDSQQPDGDLPHTAPSCPGPAGGGPFWQAFVVAAPWYVYRQYDDRRILENNYPVMQKWLDFIEEHSKNGNLFDTLHDTPWRHWCLGDWATSTGVDQAYGPTVKLVNNCVRIYCYELMTRIAMTLEKRDDAAHYQAKLDLLRSVVHKAFYDPKTKIYGQGGQIELAFPLLTGVTPQSLRNDILNKLEQDIVEKRKGHLAVGLVGVPILVKTLIEADRNDLIFTFVNQDTCPGWGYMLKHGATTTWEHWSGERSHIHNCYNSIGMWFYQGLAGIRPDPMSPGFKHFVIHPAVVGDLTWVKASYRSVHGMIVSQWKRSGGQLEMTVSVPANTTATVYVPATDVARVTESGKSATEASGVTFLRMERGLAVFELASGHYAFVSDRGGH